MVSQNDNLSCTVYFFYDALLLVVLSDFLFYRQLNPGCEIQNWALNNLSHERICQFNYVI